MASGANPSSPQYDPLGVALGVQFEPYTMFAAVNNVAPATQAIYAIAVYATVGAVITGVKLRNSTAAVGTLPTTTRCGLCDNTGKVLALTGNVNALASWPIGVCPMPFTATFALTYTGVYYPCFIVNGTWGTTQPTPLLAQGSGSSYAADGASPPPAWIWAGQTDIPTVGNSATITNPNNRCYYLALY